MDIAFKLYIAAWATACLVAVLLYLRRRGDFAISRRAYWHFLAEPWKLVTFVGATAIITLVAPYTGDGTWDYADGLFMSVFCFATAPWVVAVLHAAAKGRARWDEVYVAVCAWLFSASWSYDIYLVWRDGDYSPTWYPNLYASSLIYLGAGLFWNLEHQSGRGVTFSFMDEDWPRRPQPFSLWRIALYAAIFALPTVAAVAIFFID
ncbi:MAG TPA: hypothetical protein VFF03_02800 [Rhodocyclaceae bacterium]|nr:hypothetical protein [Rhodocyclaceae bacterium]